MLVEISSLFEGQVALWAKVWFRDRVDECVSVELSLYPEFFLANFALKFLLPGVDGNMVNHLLLPAEHLVALDALIWKYVLVDLLVHV